MNENMIGVIIFIAVMIAGSVLNKIKEAGERRKLEEEQAARRTNGGEGGADLPEATRRQLYGDDDSEWIPVNPAGRRLEKPPPSRPPLQARPATAQPPPPLRRESAAPEQQPMIRVEPQRRAPAQAQEFPVPDEIRQLQETILRMKQQMQQMQQTYQRTELERRRLAENEARQREHYQRMQAQRQMPQQMADVEGCGAPGEGTADGEGPAARKRQQRQKSAAPPPIAPPRRPALFANLGEIRRGIILAEVLGPPKGLQD